MNDRSQLRWTFVLAAVVLLVVTCGVYLPVRSHGFINFDDPDYVGSNPRVQAGLTLESIRWAFTESHSSNWHPVTWMSHMLDCQWFGVQPGAHHVVNLGLHLLNTLLLLVFLVRVTGDPWRSWVVAGFFALHPLHVESVAWIAERKDLLSTGFGLLTLMAYVGYVKRRSTGRNGLAMYLLALVWFALGLMSKPMLVTWPCVLLLLDFWPLQRFQLPGAKAATTTQLRLGQLVIEKLPFFALTIAASVITSLVQRGSGATMPLSVLPMSVRVANMAMAYVAYLRKTFWPDDLAVFYPYVVTSWESARLWCALALLAGISYWLWRRWRSQPAVLMGWCWFLGTLVPVIGLVQVGRQGMADRYTYIPHLGLFIAVTWGLAELLKHWAIPARVQMVLGVAALVACAVLTSRQVAFWENTATLSARTVRVTKDNFIAHTQYATTLLEAGKIAEALAECDTALRITPDYAEAYNTRGAAFVRMGDLAAARTNYLNAARFDTQFPDPHHALADIAIREGRFADAVAHSRDALRIAPLHVGAHYTLAQALHGAGQLDEAIAAYQELDRLKPGVFQVHRGLGSLYVLKGDLPAAVTELQRALQIVPAAPETLNALGTVLLDLGDLSGASNQFSAVLKLDPTNGIANFKIGQLLTVAKRDRDAVPFYQAALRAWPDSVEALNNLAWTLATSADASIRDGATAVRLATRAVDLTGNRAPLLLGTLAAAHAEAGQFADAIQAAEKAVTLARSANQTNVVQRNLELLELYRAGKAYHEP